MKLPSLPLPDRAPDFPLVSWEASWIWTSEPCGGRHDFVCLRREFSLADSSGQIILRLAAERDASVWINGHLIHHGPPISDPRFKRYESIDVGGYLQEGVNALAIRVYHDRTAVGAFTAHPEACGLLAQLETGEGNVIVASGTDWKASRSRAHIPIETRFGDSMWVEVFDARLDTPGWTVPGFDDRDWPSGVPKIADKHPLWSAQQPQARFFPWVNLIPCETRPPVRERCLPKSVLQIGEVLQRRESTPQDTAIRMSLEPILPQHKTVMDGIENLLRGNGSVMLQNSSPTESYETFDGLRNVTIVFDFGHLMNARFGFSLETADSAQVDIGYGYHLEEGRVIPYTSMRGAQADFYVARTGVQEWESADWRHFRYVQLTFRNLVRPLELRAIWADAIHHGMERKGAFSSDDPVLNEAFELVMRTADLSVTDRTMDNPSRERKQYLGDCSSILSAFLDGYGDNALIHRYFLNAGEGQHITGLYRYSYPGHNDDGPSLFDHALSLPLRLWEHYQQFGKTALIEKLWPGLSQFLELVCSCLDDKARMTLPPYNIWFDWGHMDRRGFFLPLQAMSCRALRCAADLAEAIGQNGTPHRELAEAMQLRIPDWFDSERGCFVDAIVDGQRQEHASEHANSLIACWQLAPQEQIDSFLHCWERDPDSFGQTSPAWHYLPEAFFRARRPDLALRWIHRRMGQITAQGLQPWPETWCLYGERTTGQWRCRNSRAVAQGAGLSIPSTLLAGLCGIEPMTPGFATVHICPQPGPLKRISGSRPGPDGMYQMQLTRNEPGWHLTLHLPSERMVLLELPFAPETSEITVNGHLIKATNSDKKGTPQFHWQAEAHSEIYIR